MEDYGLGPLRVAQLGRPDSCAQTACGKHAQYRVILGGWDVQVYACTDHLAWAVRLDMHREREWAAMGAVQNTTVHATQVVPEIGVILRTDFARPITVSTAYPVARERHYDDDGSVWYLPCFHEDMTDKQVQA